MSDSSEKGAPKSRSSSSDSSTSELTSGSGVLPDLLTATDIQQLLLENQKIIQAVYQNQNLGKLTECCQYLEILQRNVLALGKLADRPGQIDPNQLEWPPSPAHRWALDEIERLRLALSTYGPANMESIVRFVATKSEEEIIRTLPNLGPVLRQGAVPGPNGPHPMAANLHMPPRSFNPLQSHQASQGYGNAPNQPTAVDPSPSPPPAVATVSLSHVATIRQAPTTSNTDRSRYAANQSATHYHVPPSTSQAPLAFVQPNQAFIAQQSPPSGGTISFSSNPAPPARHTSPPGLPVPGTMNLGGIRTPMSSHNAMPPPVEVNSPPNGSHNHTFSSYQTYFPPPIPSSSQGSMYNMSAPIEPTQSSTQLLPTVPPAPMMAQPAISISMDYDMAFNAQQQSSNPSPPTSRRVGVYTPAPGQVMVNMDKTTLFTPSNPPRPGSPRSPRSPKTPKSPKSPKTPKTPLSPAAPLSPKSPGGIPVSPKSPKDTAS